MTTHADSRVVFAHVPHTAGRAAKRYLWIHYPQKHISIHTPEDIDQLTIAAHAYLRYFVLRDPVHRIIAEYLHYSVTLSDPTGGRIGYLSLDDARKQLPSFNPSNLLDYVRLPITNDVCCKLLLLRTDWNKPISAEEYQTLLRLVSLGIVKHDPYVVPMRYTQLATLFSVDVCGFNSGIDELSRASYRIDPLNEARRRVLLEAPGVEELIKSRNRYDCLLYDYLIFKSV